MKAPMLAATVENVKDLVYPVLGSAKLDGVRCIVEDGVPLSRNAKPIRNKFVQKWFHEHDETEGLDGELIVGPPNVHETYRVTNSAVMSTDGEPDFNYYVFDHVLKDDAPFSARYAALLKQPFTERVVVLEQCLIKNEEELRAYEENAINLGFEGLILRKLDGRYKHGRSTMKEHLLMKLKRFTDAEAEIVDLQEEMQNLNISQMDAFGHTERSSHKENMRGKGTLGALVVRDLKTDVEFNIGSGFDAQERARLWKDGKKLIGKIVKYQHFPVGAKDKPRFPTYLGFRDQDDM
jgi:DNA ligase-1